MATIRQIAEQCGVVPSTVTKALKDQPGVRSETRERILSCAGKLGYPERIDAGKSSSMTGWIVKRRRGLPADAFPLSLEGELLRSCLNDSAFHYRTEGTTDDFRGELCPAAVWPSDLNRKGRSWQELLRRAGLRSVGLIGEGGSVIPADEEERLTQAGIRVRRFPPERERRICDLTDRLIREGYRRILLITTRDREGADCERGYQSACMKNGRIPEQDEILRVRSLDRESFRRTLASAGLSSLSDYGYSASTRMIFSEPAACILTEGIFFSWLAPRGDSRGYVRLAGFLPEVYAPLFPEVIRG